MKCYYYFIAWSHFSFVFHVDFSSPNLEIHLPFGFVRIGWERENLDLLEEDEKEELIKKHTFNLTN